MRVVKIIFIHDDGYSREKCKEFIMTPVELTETEIKKFYILQNHIMIMIMIV